MSINGRVEIGRHAKIPLGPGSRSIRYMSVSVAHRLSTIPKRAPSTLTRAPVRVRPHVKLSQTLTDTG